MGVEYRVLGPVEALVDGDAVALAPKERAVLAVLALHANHVVAADRLIDAVWPDEPPETAANLIQGYVSQLRRRLGRDAIQTRDPGYLLRAADDAVDLAVFERHAASGRAALGERRAAEAAERLGQALAIWRGPALADVAADGLLGAEAARLDELRLTVQERRIEADVECGRHADVIAGLEQLVAAHPYREHPYELLVLALYRSGRQMDALAAYQSARRALADDLGLEPGRRLQELERQVLAQDPGLEHATGPPPQSSSLLAWALEPGAATRLVDLAAALAREVGAELVLATTVASAAGLDGAVDALEAQRRRVPAARVAAFTSAQAGADLARLAAEQDSDLVLVDLPGRLLDDVHLATLFADAPCDVAAVGGGAAGDGPVLVPFTGVDHDWAAVELAAWIARSRGTTVRLAGAAVGPSGRDASRLLASASLAVQRGTSVSAAPLVVEPSPEALLEAAADAGLVVVGLPTRWRSEGLGVTRGALAESRERLVILVRRGLRPGALAPRGSETRYTWTVAAG